MDFVKDFLKTELKKVSDFLNGVHTPQGNLMGQVANFVFSGKGKMLRPAIVCLSAKSLGYHDMEEAHHCRLGAAVELFHVATLLHDDVIDKAPLRRGKPTVNNKWGDDVAILFADYLYASCFDLALEVLNPEVVRILTQTTRKMTEGEMFQIEKRDQWLNVEEYETIINAKTAWLFAACSSLGAVLAEAPPDIVKRYFEFGLHFGKAFQITDDALDYEAQGDKWGKRVGSDLKEGKQTLPLLYTLDQASSSDRELLISTLNNGRDFETVHGFIKKYNGIEYSLEQAAESNRKALEQLDGLEETEALACLRRMADQLVLRQV